MMGHYMHSIVEKTWPDKLREELFKKFIGDYNAKVDTLKMDKRLLMGQESC